MVRKKNGPQFSSNLGTVRVIGIIYKKIPCYMHDSFAGGLLFKMLKYFEVNHLVPGVPYMVTHT